MYRRLRYLRENNKIIQLDLAKILNLGKSQYSLYESESISIPIKHLITLCNYFDVSLDYIFEFTDKTQYDDVMKIIDKKKAGNRLRNFRKLNKMSQTNLAELLKISFSAVSSYERGINILPTNYLYTLCKKYKMSADYLLGRIDKMPF